MPHPVARLALTLDDAERVVARCAPDLGALAGKTVLVTGATGFIGGSVADALVAFNSRASAPCRLLLASRSLRGARVSRPDLQDARDATWLEWPEGARLPDVPGTCEYIVHAAAPGNAAAFAADSARGAVQTEALAANVAEWARRHGTQSLVLLSSGAVYGRPPEGLQTLPEMYAGTPAPGYGEAKRRCELLLESAGFRTSAARLFACYGPRQGLDCGLAIPDFFRQLLSTGRIEVASDGRARRAFAYISDVVTVLLKLLVRGGPETAVCNVGADSPVVSIAELAHLVARAWGGANVLVRGGGTDTARPSYVPDITRMSTLHRPEISLEAGLRRLADHHRGAKA